MTPEIEILYTEYRKNRLTSLTLDQFTSFLAFFPVLLVAASDGIVDSDEWQYCRKLAYGLGASYSEELDNNQTERLTISYRKEFGYLLQNLKTWEEPFLVALEHYFNLNNYAKKFVAQTAWLFADASDGVSQTEKMKMRELAQRYNLELRHLKAIEELRESLS